MKRRFISDRKILAGFLATASLCLTFAPAHAQFAEMFRDRSWTVAELHRVPWQTSHPTKILR